MDKSQQPILTNISIRPNIYLEDFIDTLNLDPDQKEGLLNLIQINRDISYIKGLTKAWEDARHFISKQRAEMLEHLNESRSYYSYGEGYQPGPLPKEFTKPSPPKLTPHKERTLNNDTDEMSLLKQLHEVLKRLLSK